MCGGGCSRGCRRLPAGGHLRDRGGGTRADSPRPRHHPRRAAACAPPTHSCAPPARVQRHQAHPSDDEPLDIAACATRARGPRFPRGQTCPCTACRSSCETSSGRVGGEARGRARASRSGHALRAAHCWQFARSNARPAHAHACQHRQASTTDHLRLPAVACRCARADAPPPPPHARRRVRPSASPPEPHRPAPHPWPPPLRCWPRRC